MRPSAWLAIVALVALDQTVTARAHTPPVPPRQENETAILAAGCFWCVEADLSRLTGVVGVETGYTGGEAADPTYQSVVSEPTGHLLAVRVTFDPEQVSYEELLIAYYLSIDPVDPGGQACERGPAYRAAVFYHDDAQAAAAARIEAEADAALGRPVAVELRPAERFWPAEAANQDYAAKYPLRYDFYRRACGRDDAVRSAWHAAAPLVARR